MLIRRPAVAAFLLASLAAFPAILFTVRHQPGKPIAQAVSNLAAVEQASLFVAIEKYPKYFAPLYPAVLWIANQARLTPDLFNVTVEALLVGLLAATVQARHGSIAAALAALLLVTLYPSVRNVFHITAEPLFALVSLGAFLLVDRREISLARATGVGALAGVAALTRYFGFFWPAAPLLLALALANGTRGLRIARVAMAGGVTLLIAMPWLVYVRVTTGHFSGTVRQGGGQKGEFEHWNEHRDFVTNVAFSVKTVLVDWLSWTRIANHRAMIEERISGMEWMTIAIALILLGWGALAVRRAPRAQPEGPPQRVDGFVAAFFALLIGVWSVANNDPIHTRFVFPVYPFLIVLGFAWAHRAGGRFVDRAPFALLYVLCLATSVARHAAALTRPAGG